MSEPARASAETHATAERPVYFLDIEVYRNVFLVTILRDSDNKVRIFEQSERETIDYDLLRRILLSGTVVTFNGKSYDIPILWYAIEGAEEFVAGELVEDGTEVGPAASIDQLQRRDRTCAEIKRASDRIIKGGVKWWKVEETLGIAIPRGVDHIDLIEPQPNPFASLKILHGRMHGRWLQDLPYHHDSELTFAEIDKLREYNVNDVQATKELYHALAEPLELREKFGEQIGMDLRSLSDTQMGLAIIKQRCEKALGRRIRLGTGETADCFRYTPPDYIRYESPVLRDMLARIREHDFFVQANGKVELPDFLTKPFRLGASEYAMGIGGLHSTEANRAIRSDYESVLVDADVASYYPAIILSLGLYPADIGPTFLDVYRGIRDERVVAKRAKNKVADKGLKIALNGTFGSLGSPYKIVYAPHLMISVTITGQLALLMLIERAELAGIPVVSANTDGVLFLCPREWYGGIERDRLRDSVLADITRQWEKETQFDLEFVEYRAIYNQSVNSYFAIKADGGHKRKGPLGNPWSKHPDDYDPVRGQLMKNPQFPICSDAALARIKDGTPVSETIRNCRDIRQFVSLIRATKGATWRGRYLGKVVRFYYATDGDPILEAEPHPTTGNYKTVAKTDGCRPIMTFEENPQADDDIPWACPGDIDYARYEAEAEEILKALGFYGTPPPPLRMGRLTREKLERLTPWLELA